ncbi:MAG TPA: CvpA family protein [Chitinophagales bacterium]|nr:CvpA family protein [Chitinophagales bacterium]
MLIDTLLIIFLIAGFINGFRRGLIYSLCAFIGLFFGMLLAMKYSYLLSGYLYEEGIIRTRLLPFISFALIFIAVMIAMKLAYRLVQSMADTLFLGTINNIIGGMLWAAILALLFSTVLWYLDKMSLIPSEAKAASKTYSYIISLSSIVVEKLSGLIPYFKGMFDAIEHLFKEPPPSQGIEV